MNARPLIRTLALSWTLGLIMGAGLASAKDEAPAPKALAPMMAIW